MQGLLYAISGCVLKKLAPTYINVRSNDCSLRCGQEIFQMKTVNFGWDVGVTVSGKMQIYLRTFVSQ